MNDLLVLHATWLPAADRTGKGEMAVWAEDTSLFPMAKRGRPPQKSNILPHPFHASSDQIARGIESLQDGRDSWTRISLLPHQFPAWLPSGKKWPLPSPAAAHAGLILISPAGESVDLKPWLIDGLTLPPEEAISFFNGLPPGTEHPEQGIIFGPDLHFWQVTARLALEFLVRERYFPDTTCWQPVLTDPGDQTRLASLARLMPLSCRAGAKNPALEPALSGAEAVIHDFLSTTIDATIRKWGPVVLKTIKKEKDRSPKDETATSWKQVLINDIVGDPEMYRENPALQEALKRWSAPVSHALETPFHTCFRLEPPEKEGEDAWFLSYWLQANDDPSLLVSAEQVWQESMGVLRYLTRTWENPQERLLADLGRVQRLFNPVAASLSSPRPTGCALTTAEAYGFLLEVVPQLEQTGLGVILPAWWTRKNHTGLGVRVRLHPSKTGTATVAGKGILGLDNLLAYDWELALGEDTISKKEMENLLALKQPLVRLRGQWVVVDAEQVKTTLRRWDKRGRQGLSLVDAFRLETAKADGSGPNELPILEVTAEGWLQDLLARLNGNAPLPQLSPPAGFSGQLRPYQQRGTSWLHFMGQYSMGACLADDMGLGKTIQVLALLLHLQEQELAKGPGLLLCPTSVLGNWQHETARFAPSLKVYRHHGPERLKGEAFRQAVAGSDLVLTTYPLAHRDAEELGSVSWDGVILDEAQNIKNPGTKQSQAIRRLPGRYRLALSGTPVENRLGELWSIMEFLNPGYLGSAAGFHKSFAVPIERDRDEKRSRELRRLVQPFILRRLKTDPAIVPDLPAKQESVIFCPLKKEQVTLYEAVVRDAMKRIDESEGMERRGLVLGLLTRLKQVCNHPAHFLGDGSPFPERSGKLTRLEEMLEEILSLGERALIFSQFSEFGTRLREHLQAVFGREVLFLHGGVPASKRSEMVTRFQEEKNGPSIFVLSIKAGGTGLNLTRANHVFHFDRWWNPAVENQATDRAFRIGQQRNVLVYKFVSIGTLEEQIDALIEQKKALAEKIIGSGEGWLTEISTAALHDLVSLRKDIITDE